MSDLLSGDMNAWNLLWLALFPIIFAISGIAVGWEKWKARGTPEQRRAAAARAVVDELERREKKAEATVDPTRSRWADEEVEVARGEASKAAHAALEEELDRLTEQWQDSVESEHDEPLFTKRWEQD